MEQGSSPHRSAEWPPDEWKPADIDDGLTLTNSISFTGGMTITNTGSGDHGKFVNDFVVSCDNATLIVIPYELDDTSSALWSVLLFGTLQLGAATGPTVEVITGGSLSGDFGLGASSAVMANYVPDLVTTGELDLTKGELRVHENFTLGDNANNKVLMFGAGTIVVDAGKTFTHE